jgi:membrane protein DedA with SNARE-associated domain
MPFSGYLVYLGRFNLFLVATPECVGCNLGSAIGYWIGAKGGRPLRERYGKWVLMSHHDLDRMTWFFESTDRLPFFWGACCRWCKRSFRLPAGIARMPRLRFHIYTSLGSLIWYSAWPGRA